MKNHCFSLLFVLFGCVQYAFSQQATFIEVISLDTITLKPTQLTYKINFGNEMDYVADNQTLEDQLGKEASVSDLLHDLKRADFKIVAAGEGNYSISGYTEPISITIRLENQTELKKLYDLLKTKEGITGSVDNVSFESASNYYPVSFKKLYANAMSQATQLAEIANRKLGSLLAVSEIRGEYDGWAKMYEEIMKNIPGGLFGASNPLVKTVERKFLFRFSLD